MRRAIFLLLLFVLLALPFLSLTGPQYDEMLFGAPVFSPLGSEFSIGTPWGRVPLMLMSFLGALKSWLWFPVLKLAGVSLVTLRLPALLMAGAAAWLFFLAARRMAGQWAALLVLLLLVTDANYMISSLYDWGPVAMQHLFWAGILYAGLRYGEEGRARWAAIAMACLGLALWDKAIGLWLVGGFGVSLLIFYPRRAWDLVRARRTVAWCALALVLGALPLLYYNRQQRLRTLRSNLGWQTSEYADKLTRLDVYLGGSGLLGYLTRDQDSPAPPDLTSLERASITADRWMGGPLRSLQRGLVAIVLLALPLLWFTPGGRRIAFFATGGALSALLMFSTPNAGGSVHHDILLWPLPQLLIGLAAAEAMRVFGKRVAAVVILAAISNIAVMNHLHARLLVAGTSVEWSDATPAMVAECGRFPGRSVFATEWGILMPVHVLSGGRCGIVWASDAALGNLQEAWSKTMLERAFTTPTLFIGHAPEAELKPGSGAVLDGLARAAGLEKSILSVVADRHGHPVYQVFEYHRP